MAGERTECVRRRAGERRAEPPSPGRPAGKPGPRPASVREPAFPECDSVTYRKHVVGLRLHFLHGSPRTLSLSSVMTVIKEGVLVMVAKVTLGEPLRMGARCQGNAPRDWRVQPPDPCVRENRSPMVRDFIRHAEGMGPLERPKSWGFGERLGWGLREHGGAVPCTPRPCPMPLFRPAVPALCPL